VALCKWFSLLFELVWLLGPRRIRNWHATQISALRQFAYKWMEMLIKNKMIIIKQVAINWHFLWQLVCVKLDQENSISRFSAWQHDPIEIRKVVLLCWDLFRIPLLNKLHSYLMNTLSNKLCVCKMNRRCFWNQILFCYQIFRDISKRHFCQKPLYVS